MKIQLKDLKIVANLKKHYDHEKSDKQEVLIDIIFNLDINHPKILQETIDYVNIENAVIDLIKIEQFDIIEDLAISICERLLQQFKQITYIQTKVSKFNVLKNTPFVSVIFEKHRNDIKLIFSLGSNLGNREDNIIRGYTMLIEKLGLQMPKISKFIYTKAMLTKDCPAEWNLDFANICISGYCDKVEPIKLLNISQEIEFILNNGKKGLKNEPRYLDIDILYFGGRIISLPNLQIPHNQLHNRDFVLKPLKEIEPDLLLI